MEAQYDHKQFAILYVDDEELSLKSFARAFSDEFRIYTATNAKDGLKLIEEQPGEIGILMTDQKMPGEKGTWLSALRLPGWLRSSSLTTLAGNG